MATTTPNFGWAVPTSTDLVKDGAVAIETLGDSIDASLVDLKGGTTGQVLSKASNTDMDFTWVTDAAGDITGVTAGTGISGGGTSGTVTVTNSMATAIDAKGDLIGGTGADAFTRLAVGTNGQVLTADSAETTGLKWTTVAGGSSGPAFSAYRGTSNQSFSSVTFTKVQLNAEDFDTDNCFDPTTNYRFTPNKAGKYQMNTTLKVTGGSSVRNIIAIYKNGSNYLRLNDETTGGSNPTASASVLIDMNGTTDYLELYVFSFGATPVIDAMSGGEGTVLSGVWTRS
jgi:hypothetical protein